MKNFISILLIFCFQIQIYSESLDQLIKDDGTINSLTENSLTKNETIRTLNSKLDEVFDVHLTKWLDKNIPNYLEKYFNKKDI